MGRKNRKSARAVEKKQERLALEKRMNERVAIVNAANKQEDPMSSLPSFQVFSLWRCALLIRVRSVTVVIGFLDVPQKRPVGESQHATSQRS